MDGTLQADSYQYAMPDAITLVPPADDVQPVATEAIHAIKSGQWTQPKLRLIEGRQQLPPIDAVSAGWTDIPLVLTDSDLDVYLTNPSGTTPNYYIIRVSTSNQFVAFSKRNTGRRHITTGRVRGQRFNPVVAVTCSPLRYTVAGPVKLKSVISPVNRKVSVPLSGPR